jgi:hypothetical protein
MASCVRKGVKKSPSKFDPTGSKAEISTDFER